MNNIADIDTVSRLLRAVAQQELLPRFNQSDWEMKSDGSPVTEADTAVQDQLKQQLAANWPDYDFVGEEMDAPQQAHIMETATKGFWCLDPLDGTRNFALGIPFFSTSLALFVDRVCVLGVVYDPVRDECFSAVRGKGAWLNGTSLKSSPSIPSLKDGIGLIDFKRLDKALASRLASAPPFSSQRSFGSVALDWCWLAASRCHVYIHGSQKIWDNAAGRLILAESNGYAVDLEGKPLQEMTLEPQSVVAAPTADLFAEWLEWLKIDASQTGPNS